MANVQAPFGFSQWSGTGSIPTHEMTIRKIASANATAVFFGDPVSPLATGYITRATAGTVRVEGIFVGCQYFSTSQQQTVWRRYWPGSDATGDVTAYLITDPNAQFLVQAGGTNIGFANIGEYIQFNLGTGSTASGQSGAYVESPNTTVTLPFVVRALVADPPTANGTDIASAYNYVIVGFNNQSFRTNGAGPLGIA